MASLSFVTTCMGRLAHLKRTLPLLVQQKDCACIVVDYSCPDQCGDWVEMTYSQVRVVRVPGRKTFSRSCAVNAGGWAAETPWVCFLDSDIFIDPDFAEKVLPLLEPGYYYGADPILDPALCGTFICSRKDFRRVGGYDEVYQGWGEEDIDVYSSLEFLGLQRKTFPSSWIRHLPHGNESRVQFHEIKKHELARAINRIYRFVKSDKMHVTEKFLPIAEREGLYAEIAEKGMRAFGEGKALELTVEIPGRSMVLIYELEDVGDRRTNSPIHLLTRSPIVRRLRGAAKNTMRSLAAASGLLRRAPPSVNMGDVTYRRDLPFEKKLELRLSSRAGGLHLEADRQTKVTFGSQKS